VAIKVLIAHGNTQRLKQAVADLHSAGFEVVATPDGGDAFARFFEEMPDLVICSMVLPSLAGPGIARMVRSQSPQTSMVLVVEDMREVVEAGVIKVEEPLTLAKLREALPDITFDAPSTPADDPQDLTAASPQQVFFHAVLKRFQRDNRALQTLDDTGIARMAALCDNRNYGDGQRIILQGDPGDGFYLLVEGQVKVTLAEKDDKEVARIAAGGFFGEMAMLKDQRRSASVWSIGQSTTLYFSKELILPFLNDYPAMREVLSGVALKRTEENLWRVLFDDDEVQRSIATLGDAEAERTRAAAFHDEAREPTPELKIAKPAFTKTITPAAVLLTPEEAAQQKKFSDLMRDRAFMVGLAVGFVGGAILTYVIDASRAKPAAVAASAPVTPAQVVKRAEPLKAEPSTAPVKDEAPRDTVKADALKLEPPQAEPPQAEPPKVEGAKVEGAKVEGAKVEGAKVEGAKVEGAKVEGAKVEGAKVEGAKVEGAKVEGAKVEGAKVEGAKSERLKGETPKAEAKPDASPERELLSEASKAGNYKQVLASAKKLPQPLDADAAFMVCEAQRQTGAPNALQAYMTFITEHPNHGRTDDAQFWAAEMLVQQGRTSEARVLYEKVAGNERSNFRNSAAKRLQP
jgi:CRP-like cAMP-binding protein/TolA-binding protein